MMPIYTEIMDELVTGIRNGQYRPNTVLPSEHEMCKRFKVSRGSVRNALKAMEEKGYIHRRQGSGSFVRERKDETISQIVNLGIILNSNSQHTVKDFTDNPFFGKKYRGIRDAAVAHRANPSLFIYEDDKDIDETLFAGYDIEGFLDTGATISEKLNEYFVRNQCKVCSMTNSFHLHKYKFDWPLVVNDYMGGVRKAAKFYKQQGLKKFGFLAIAKDGFANFKLYKDILTDENLDFDISSVVLFPEQRPKMVFQEERAKYFARQLFGQDSVPDVLFTDGHFVAKELIQYLQETDQGRDIFDRIRFCVIGDPDIEMIDFSGTMDFVVPDNEGVGRKTTELLIESINGRAHNNERLYVPSGFVSQEKE